MTTINTLSNRYIIDNTLLFCSVIDCCMFTTTGTAAEVNNRVLPRARVSHTAQAHRGGGIVSDSHTWSENRKFLTKKIAPTSIIRR